MFIGMAVKLKLGDYLKAHNITPYRLAKESRLTTNAIYNMTDEETPPISIRFDSLSAILNALYAITGKPIEVSDLISFKPDE
jgi:hypothetical protein